MSLLSRLLGRSSAPEAEPEVYNGFRIYADPGRSGAGYRIGARIEREIGGEVKSHSLIRADTFESVEQATEASILKAKMLIDEQGDDLFR